ncbi:helix-turn-helix domain-containing protein [Vibrio mediterranei]|uniref:helix-turn-helix domain-containing protein n=1 Tax=Vibrio mediterranei TaxID=689 RepID=UPI00148B9176|nr:helix-turn-helix transcriptional regulator [Vibrio mediterranei]NOI26696.1 helix-turn-helix transcriptional regulator [Vibrio mediterranei]
MKSNNLRALRKSAGYESAAEFASALNCPLSTVISHENGNRDISERYLKIYSEFLNVSKTTILKKDALIVQDRLVDVIYSICKIQQRHRKEFSKDFIFNLLYQIEKYDVNGDELDLFIESYMII